MGSDQREELRARLIAETPRWYVPSVHMLVPSLVGLTAVVWALLQLQDVVAAELLTVPLVYVLANAVEWWVHGHALHRRHPLAPVLYDQHTPKHHRLYVTEEMAIRDRREYRLVLIPAYGLFLMFAGTIPVTAALWWYVTPNVAWLYVATAVTYAISYEWLHLSYHLPHGHPVGRLRLVQWLRRHHAIHHDPALMQQWNLNVTVPLWDRIMRTSVPERATVRVSAVARQL